MFSVEKLMLIYNWYKKHACKDSNDQRLVDSLHSDFGLETDKKTPMDFSPTVSPTQKLKIRFQSKIVEFVSNLDII